MHRRKPLLDKLIRSTGILFLAWTVALITSTTASAQSGSRVHSYFQQFYGQDFYDGQHKTTIFHRDWNKQYHLSNYSPAMMYSRQYVDQVGYPTDPPIWRAGGKVQQTSSGVLHFGH
jgi:hypothetical protein